MRLFVEVQGVNVVSQALTTSSARAGNMQIAGNEILNYLRRITAKQFSTQGERGLGHQWAPLSEKWLRYKAAHGLDPRILHMRHPLRDSVTKEGAVGSVAASSRSGVIFGTDIKYAAKHQFGSPTRNVPKRPFLVLRREDDDAMKRIVSNWVLQPLDNIGAVTPPLLWPGEVFAPGVIPFGGGRMVRGRGGRFVRVVR
jgi:phage gpG-like protein